MKKWLIPLVGLAAVVITGTAVGLATAGGADTPTGSPPNECNLVDDIKASKGSVTDKAKSDLGDRLDMGAEGIDLVSRERVDWPDTSLGVPKPGMMYAEVVTPGYKIVLSAGGQSYEYHSDLFGTQIVAAW